MATRKQLLRLKTAYDKAKAAKVGESITCPTCGTTFTKKTYQQAFCNPNRCKDGYWNTVSPKKRDKRRFEKYNVGKKSYSAFQERMGNDVSYYGSDDAYNWPEGWDEHKNDGGDW